MAQKQIIKDYTLAEVVGDLGMFFEKRLSYSGTDVEYVGYNREPDASTTEETWFIIKNEYSGGNLTRYRLPDNGPQFKYAWDSRASYFA